MKYVPGLDANWKLRWKWTLHLWYWQFREFLEKHTGW